MVGHGFRCGVHCNFGGWAWVPAWFTVKLVVWRGYGMGFTIYLVVGHGFWRGVWWLGLCCWHEV